MGLTALTYGDSAIFSSTATPKVWPVKGARVGGMAVQKPPKLVILLHGYGSNAEDLLALAPELAEALPRAYFMAVNAPEPCESAMSDSYQWFSLQGVDLVNPDLSVDYLASGWQQLQEFILEQLKRWHLSWSDVILVGFSQGAALAIYAALFCPAALAGVLSYSGFLTVEPERLETLGGIRTKICMIHGEDDMVVPPERFWLAKRLLQRLDPMLVTHCLPNLGHAINRDGLELGKDFLANL